jgi:hypothetical protein
MRFFTYNNQLRSTDDEQVASNLSRKGWTQIFHPPLADNEMAVFDEGAGAFVAVPKPAVPLQDATALQVRVWMARNGIDPATVPDIITAAVPEGPQRVEALQRWEYATAIPADNALVAIVAAGLNPPVTVAEVWPEILAI